MRRVKYLAWALGLFLVCGNAHAATYIVDLDGATIDLGGFIEIDVEGTFSPAQLDAHLLDYEIAASQNGSFPFLFTRGNSFWGYGGNVSIEVTPDHIALTAPTGGSGDAGNLFLLASAVTNGARENLRLFQDTLGYRRPNPPDGVVFDTVSTPFILAVRPCGNGTTDTDEDCDDGALNGTTQSCCAADCRFIPSGVSCDDEDACTQVDECDGGGACVGSAPVVCAALDQCHDAGTCDPATGVCDDPEKPAGSACDDGDACTLDDTCQAGACEAGEPTLLNPLADPGQLLECVEQTVGSLP